MTYDVTTTNLADFGQREIKLVSKLLDAWVVNGLPDDFDSDGVMPMMNRHSGSVFLTNNEYQVAVLGSPGRLVSFYVTPYEGHEGTLGDLLDEMDEETWHPEDLEYIRQLQAS